MGKSIVLLERPVRKSFDATMREQVEEALKEYIPTSPVPVVARWQKDQPLLRLETKLGLCDVTFGPENFRVEVNLNPLGLFLNTQKTRQEALGLAQRLADAVGI